MKLKAWRVSEETNPLDDPDEEAQCSLYIQEGKRCLQDQVDVIIFLKQSGPWFQPFWKELGNKYTKGANNYDNTVGEQHW